MIVIVDVLMPLANVAVSPWDDTPVTVRVEEFIPFTNVCVLLKVPVLFQVFGAVQELVEASMLEMIAELL